MPKSRCQVLICVCSVTLFLFLWVIQAHRSGWCQDEAAHIPAGLYHWQSGNMDAYRVNPPLPRMIAPSVLLWDPPEIRWHRPKSLFDRTEFHFAQMWLGDDKDRIASDLFRSRACYVLIAFVGVYALFRWAFRLYGAVSAAFALSIWLLMPDSVTYAATVGPDFAAGCTGLLVGYWFWEWVALDKRPYPWKLSAAVAFAVLCKFSWLILLPLLPLATYTNDICRRQSFCAQDRQELRLSIRSVVHHCLRRLRDPLKLIATYGLTILLINSAYGFQGTGTSLGDFEFISKTLSGSIQDVGHSGNRFRGTELSPIPVPIPRDMVQGLDFLKWEFEAGYDSYLRGRWKIRGWWYFYLYAMLVKIPLGYWLVFIVSVGTYLRDAIRQVSCEPFEWTALLIGVSLIVSISCGTGFTHHVRYVYPAYGMFIVFSSRILRDLSTRMISVCFCVAIVGSLSFQLANPGQSHTFFNSLSGGADNGYKHLSYSNVDWGQSTFRVAQWVREHPECRPVTVLFRTSLGSPDGLLSREKSVFVSLPTDAADYYRSDAPIRRGWCVVSSYQMTRHTNRFLWEFSPVERPYYDVLVFRFDDD